MEKENITIYDVAKTANVSLATVSRVVNGSNNVSEKTRRKVLQVIEQLGYLPNAVARGLVSKKTNSIGIIIPDISNIFFANLAHGINDIASMYGYDLILTNSNANSKQEIKALQTLLTKQVDGVIFMGYKIAASVCQELNKALKPLVLAATLEPEQTLPSINIDYEASSLAATNVLIESGNQKIALISGSITDPVNKMRLAGFKKSFQENKLAFQQNLIFEAEYNFLAGNNLAKQIKKSGCTAALITNDELALGVLNGLIDLGVKVPEDFEIITCENSVLTEYARPKMSSITQPLYDLGAVAMRLLTKLINNEAILEERIILPFQIEKRGTTK